MIEGRTGGARILRGVREGFDLTLFVDGLETNADANPTITVTRGNGTAVATGAATTKPADTTGLYRWTPAALDVADVERYTAVWTATIATVVHTFRSEHEIVGGFYCDLQEIREREGLADIGKFPHLAVVRARRWFEDLAEGFCNRAFVPRYEREVHSGDASDRLLLERHPVRQLLSVTIDDAPVAVADLEVERSGLVTYDGGFTLGDANVAMAYEHGDAGVDGELREAAIEAIADRLARSVTAVSDRAISMTTTDGTMNLSIAGPDRPTGLPSVDQVLRTRRGASVRAR